MYETNDVAKVPKYDIPGHQLLLGTKSKSTCAPQPSALSEPQPEVDPDVNHQYVVAVRDRAFQANDDIVEIEDHHASSLDQSVNPPPKFEVGSETQLWHEDQTSSRSQAIHPTAVTSSEKFVPTTVQRRRADLISRLDRWPQNLSVWLDYIDFQDEWVRQGLSSSDQQHSDANKETITRVKLGVVEDALRKLQDDEKAMDTILIKKLDLGHSIWSVQTEADEWSKASEQYPQSLGFHTAYVDFLQSRSPEFEFSICMEGYDKSWSLLRQRCSRYHPQMGDKLLVDTSQSGLELLLRLADFMKQSGFLERTNGLWQALFHLELSQTAGNAELDLADVQNFWEREESRIGEAEDREWVEANLTPPQGLFQQANLGALEAWKQSEENDDQFKSLPNRTDEEEDLADPHRVVLFSDIQKPLEGLVGLGNVNDIINAFLASFDLPLLPDLDGNSSEPCLGVGGIGPLELASSLTGNSNGLQILASLLDFNSTPDIIFASERYLGPGLCPFASLARITRQEQEFLSRVLRALVCALPSNDSLAEYYIAFEAKLSLTRYTTSSSPFQPPPPSV